MESQKEAYRVEASELLAELETSLLALEEAPQDSELIGRVFRALHTIKGSGAMFGFDDIAEFTHDVETIFDLVRNDRLEVTKTLIDLTLAAGDQIRLMLNGVDGQGPEHAATKAITAGLQAMLPISEPAAGPPNPYSETLTDEASGDVTYRISIRLDEDIFARGTNPILLLNELRELGECQVMACLGHIPELSALEPEVCYTTWDVILSTARGVDAIKDVFIFVEDECNLQIQVIDTAEFYDEAVQRKLGDILVERGAVKPAQIQSSLNKQKRLGELLVDEGLVAPDQVDAALAEQKHIQTLRQKHQETEQASSIRVPAERLDKLVNLVGELVTVQARLSQTVASMDHSELLAISEEVDRLTTELRDNTMSVRMLPIGSTFSKFKRLVRDLSGELGKQVALITEGAETELDKTVIERLNDPLVHLIRNCIDHGIEAPDVRVAAGKPPEGTVELSASHSGASVLIRIIDDGAGLNAHRIREKALEKGLIQPDVDIPEKDIFNLIFAAGFSTAGQITSVSGRGVGMDVVKRSIDGLRGSIDINSREGQGTTITLKLPLTLAIIDGLLVQVGTSCFALPLSIVEECVELTRADVQKRHGRHVTYVRGEIVPYIRLRERFRVRGELPEVEQIVITESSGGRVGLVVDKVIGEHQTVIKSMGRMYQGVDVISGATILGDGTVALIIDVPKVVEGVELLEAQE